MLDNLSKLSLSNMYAAAFGVSKQDAEEAVAKYSGYCWSASSSILNETVKIVVPAVISGLAASFLGFKIGDEHMSGAIAFGALVGLSPELAKVRNYTTDVVVDGTVRGGAKLAEVAHSHMPQNFSKKAE